MSLTLWQRFPQLQLNQLLASNASVDEDDVLNVKQRLHAAGHYEVPSYGMTHYPDSRLFAGIKSFQCDQGLTVDGEMHPGGDTEDALNQIYLQETTAPPKTLAKFFGLLPQKDLSTPAKNCLSRQKFFPVEE